MFRLVFVMDIFNRNVVLAKGGIRENYRPVSDSSAVCRTSDPLEILEILRPKEVYIADLNVLQGKGPLDMNAEIIGVSLKRIHADSGVFLKDVDRALLLQDRSYRPETGTLED